MFGLGLPELIVIFVIALLVFGPKKLPDMGKSIGRAIAEFKKASEDFQETVRAEMKEAEKASGVDEVKKITGSDLMKEHEGVSSAEQAAGPKPDDTKKGKEKDGEAARNG